VIISSSVGASDFDYANKSWLARKLSADNTDSPILFGRKLQPHPCRSAPFQPFKKFQPFQSSLHILPCNETVSECHSEPQAKNLVFTTPRNCEMLRFRSA
jgi:hypothetical protein